MRDRARWLPWASSTWWDLPSWAEGRKAVQEESLALSRFESAAWLSAVLAGGRVVKMIGDEVFFAAPSVDAACRIGTGSVLGGRRSDPLLPPAWGAVGQRSGDAERGG